MKQTCLVLIVVLMGCGDTSSPDSRAVSAGVFSGQGNATALQAEAAAVAAYSGPKMDPCLGTSEDGICYGLANAECNAAFVVAGECLDTCNGTCINGLSTFLPTCQCDAGFESPCAELQPGGECRQDVLLRCEDGVLLGVDCRATGGSPCVQSDKGAGCGAVGNVSLCGALVEGPACEGNVWVQCKDGVVNRTDCTEQGLLCGWGPSREGFGCY